MQKILKPQDQTFWYLKKNPTKQLTGNTKIDVAIVGGGMAGLTAAQSFLYKGYSVAVLEKYYCGSGASGKSSGFITPDSELTLNYFNKKFGELEAKKIWEFVTSGVSIIENNIKQFNINCDYKVQDTLIVANSKTTFSKIKAEYETRKKLGYEGLLYDKSDVQKILNSQKYFGGVSYSGSFGIAAYDYCQAMKIVLEDSGVQFFEETPAINIKPDKVQTPHGNVQAKYIIVCVDRFLPDLQKNLGDKVFHAQTFLMMSEPLRDAQLQEIFPENQYMVWDTDLIYQYYRIGPENRLMLGGSDLFAISSYNESHNNYRIFEKLNNYFRYKFPNVSVNFEYFWPGLIGTSKDLRPLIGFHPKHKNIYYVTAATGLPWAAALGNYSAEKIVNHNDEFDKYFSFDRRFPLGNIVQTMLGKKITFSLSDLLIELQI